MPGYRVKPVSKAVKQKLKYDLKDYCAMRGLSLSSFYKISRNSKIARRGS